MITVKKYLKITLLLFLCFGILLCMPSCKRKKEAAEQAFVALQSLEGNVQSTLKGYQIIVSSEAGSEVLQRAKELSLKIREATALSCEVFVENTEIAYGKDAVCIYVGSTNMLKSTVQLHRDDYIYRVTDNGIVIGGMCDSATLEALDRFEQDVLPYCESSDIREHDGDFEYRHRYELEGISLCGFDISAYKIACLDGRTESMTWQAERLSSFIADRCGVCVDVVFDKSQDRDQREIILYTDESAENVSISHDGQDLIICAPDVYGLSFAVDKLFETVTEGITDGKAVVDISTALCYPKEISSISFSAIISDFLNEQNSVQNAFALRERIIAQTDAEFVFLGVVEKETWEIINRDTNINLTYSLLSCETDELHVAVLAYKTDTLKCENINVSADNGSVCISAELEYSDSDMTVNAFMLIEESADQRAEHMSVLEEKLSDDENTTLALFVCADDAPLETQTDTSVNEQVTVDLGNTKHAVNVFVTDGFTREAFSSQEHGELADISLKIAKSFYVES